MLTQHGSEWWPRLRDGLMGVIEQLARSGDSVTPCLNTIQVPTLIFQGGQDPFCPEEQGRLIARTVRGARLVYDTHAGHILAWKYPSAFREIVRDFLAPLLVPGVSAYEYRLQGIASA
jgi:pimeloyl-ACP methyl ester carboxylesterase